MSVGSPALAAYSLALTSLNARLVFRRAQRIKDKSRTDVARALVALQQTPLELTKDERLLAFIPTNDQWRQEIADRLSRRNAWSLATGSSVAWVVVAFLFTLVDSFVSLDDTIDGDSEGHAVGTLWLWLLCLVIGWLWVPTFTCGELKTAISHANQKAAKKAAKRIRQEAAKKIKQEATKAYNSAKSKITRLPKRVPLLKGPKKPVGDLPEVPEENEKVKEKEEDSKSVGEETEPNTSPLPNLARRQSTVSSQSTESQQGGGHDQPGDNANPAAGQSVVSLPRSTAARSTAAESSIHPDKDRLLIPKGTFGSLNRDELRLAATFNYSRIMGYLVLVDDVLRALDKLTREKEEVGLSRKRLMLEVVSLILSRRSGTLNSLVLSRRRGTLKPLIFSRRNGSLKSLPFSPRGKLCSLQERSLRCSMRRFSPLFSSVEHPPQPRLS